MKMFVFYLLTLVALVGCMPGKSNLKISMPKKGANVSSSVTTASISSVQVINNQLVINGNGFVDVTNVKVNGNSLNEVFSIESKTATKIIANSIRAFSFDVSKVFSLILSDANASATFAIDFSLCNATLNGKGFNCAAPVADKDVLAYDAVSGTWKPRPASGLNYLGTFDASSNPGAGPAIQPAGAYYVISDDGSIAAVNFAVGDWLVSNGSSWQKIDNSSAVLSVHGRNGAITAQQGDYTLDLLGDVSFPVAPVAGKVLKFDGTNWVAGDDLSGGGAGSVTTAAIAAGAVTDAKIDTVSASKITGTITSAQIADGTIVNADINAAAAIDYSKLNIPNTTIPYAKLNIADGAIPVAKITGIPAVTTVLSATITNGDTTHAPTSDAVYDALALKIGTNGGVLTTGTISGLPTPVGPSEAASKSYVDSEIAGITGFSETGVLATDLLGLNTGVNGPITATDSVLGAFGKMQYQVTDLKAKGLWDKTVNDIAYTAGNVSIDKKLRLKSDNANYVEILSPTSLAATYTLTLPPNDGNVDQVLKTNGTGTLSWTDITDTGVQAFAKTALPTCGASEVLKSNGTTFSCVTDASVPAFTGTANRAVATTGAGGSLAIQAVTSTELGYLTGVTSAIQTQLNAKEASLATGGTTAQYFRGDKTLATLNTAGVPELTNLYFTEARAIASPLTGVTSAAGSITAGDTILGAFGKLLNTQTDYVSKTANSTITGTLTINSIVGALKVPPPVNVDDAVPKSYVDGFGQWTKSGSDIYRDVGMIGLGTTTPDRRLTIIGDGTNYGDDIYVEAVNSETAVAQISLTRSRGTTTTRNPVLANDILGVLAYRGNDTGNTSTFPSSARIISQAETDFATAVNGNLVFQTNAAGTLSEKMRITSTGRVGIGKAPVTTLDVNGVIANGGTLSRSASYVVPAATEVIITLPNGGTDLIDNFVYKFNLVTQATGVSTGAYYIVYQTAIGTWASKLVGSSGNGAGINNPLLNINGVNVQIYHNHASSYSIGVFSEAFQTGNVTVTNPTFFGLDGIMSNVAGNVGVGTTTPGALFDLSSLTPSLRITNPNVTIPDYTATGFSPALNANTTAQWVNYSNTTGGFQLAGFTKAGVNTGVPSAIVGYHGGTAPTTPAVSLVGYKWNGVTNRVALAATEPVLQVANGGTALMTVAGGGYVGIGTANPVYHLDIQAQSTDAVVRANNFTSTGNSGGTFIGSRARGTVAAPTHPLSGDLLAQYLGKNGINGVSNPGMVIWAGENQSNTALGDYITFITTPNGATVSSEKMRITGSGNVGIGGTPDDKFYVNNGTSIGRYTTGGWTHSSDARLKHDIHTITNATEKVLKLRGVNYVLNNDPTSERQLGFIAQEVEPLFPEVVQTDKNGYKSMVYANLVAPLVEAFKDLYKKVTDIFMTTEKNTRAVASVNLKVKKLEEENAEKTKQINELKAYLCTKDPHAPMCK